MSVNRRQFLRWASAASSSAAAAGLLACDSSAAGGDADARVPSPDADLTVPDADPTMCRVTTPDALGPFFAPGAPMRTKIADDSEPGERLDIAGVVFTSEDCTTPLADVLIDVWQADAGGAYHDAGTEFRLRGQVLTDAEGRFAVSTIVPGNYENGPGAWRPAHIHFTFTKPGYNPVTTQLYFSGDPYLAPNDGCPSCGSNDPDRIIALSGDPASGWTGSWKVWLAKS